jgi:hypothetical protein
MRLPDLAVPLPSTYLDRDVLRGYRWRSKVKRMEANLFVFLASDERIAYLFKPM